MLVYQRVNAPGNHGFPPQVVGSNDAIASSMGRPVLSSVATAPEEAMAVAKFRQGTGMIQPLSLTWSIYSPNRRQGLDGTW